MTARKKVPPPPALQQSDVLLQRFSTPDDTPVTPESHASVTRQSEGLPEPKRNRPAAKKSTTRPAPPGMVRRSVYTREDALTALMEAADRVVAGTNGFTTKAEAIAALILSGVDHEDQVLEELKTRLRERLSS